jgi:hypothetical protein
MKIISTIVNTDIYIYISLLGIPVIVINE